MDEAWRNLSRSRRNWIEPTLRLLFQYFDDEDWDSIREIMDEWTPEEHSQIWGLLHSSTRARITKQIKEIDK